MNNEILNKTTLSFICSEDWDKMQPCGANKFCHQCQKEVIDFTNNTPQEIAHILQKNTVSCGRFHRSQLNWAKMVLISGFLYGSEVYAQHTPPSSPTEDNISTDAKDTFFGTIVIPMAEYKGGQTALFKFIETNIKAPENLSNIEGTVYVSFTVGIDGNLYDLKVKRGLHPLLDAEAMRVLLLTSGNWNPMEENGKKVKSQFVFPIRFKL